MNTEPTTDTGRKDVLPSYAPILLRFISQFTEDDLKARKILDDCEVLEDLRKKVSGDFLESFASILPLTRTKTLAYLRKDPSFDPFAPWKRQPDFFPLTDPSLTDVHREIFYLHYYRGVAETVIATHHDMNIGYVRQKINECMIAISRQLIFKMG